MSNSYKVIQSPVGALTLVASKAGLLAILWENDDPKRVKVPLGVEENDNPILLEAERQLRDYFAGCLDSFSVSLDFGGTAFQASVWRALLNIRYGETKTYSQIAKQIGNEKAVRAVGAAIGKNPISIIAPCHRVIGSSGKLTGFAGGLSNKARLLELETKRSMERWTPKLGPLAKLGFCL